MSGRFNFRRAEVAFTHDVIMSALAVLGALVLRIGWHGVAEQWHMAMVATLAFTLVAAAIYRLNGLHRGIWRYASLDDILAILRVATFSVLTALLALFLITRAEEVPRSALPIAWALLVLLLALPRLVYRVLKDRHLGNLLARSQEARRVPVLLVGVSDEADQFIRAMMRGDSAYRAVGILDDKNRRTGQAIRGVPILGGIEDLPKLLGDLRARGLAPQRIVVTRDLPRAKLEQLLELGESHALPLARLPRLTDFQEGAPSKLEVRPIAIEDLLNRPQTALDRASISMLIKGRRVLVTGAGGSIGAELADQIAAIGPSDLTLLDHSEYALYQADLALSERHPEVTRSATLCDIRNRQHLSRVIQAARPDLVFHAAALKHVPLVETNPEEGVLTNVIGTRNVADLAREVGAAAMVLISTDKAINPTSVMGATKRLAEAWCQTLDRASARAGDRAPGGATGTQFVTVRFGNVLGSTGSVVPLFQRQLARGGPITVTHPDMTRYFMTVREAVELVLQASSLAISDRAAGKIHVLDMGEPVKIVDLARQMIRLAGLSRQVEIVFTGLRPGEKLREELFHSAEPLVATRIQGILLAEPRTSDGAMLARALDELEAAARARRTVDVLQLLAHLVPEYRDSAPDAARSIERRPLPAASELP